MAKETKFILIETESLRELLQNGYRQGYVVTLLSYLCLRNRLDTSMTIAEACGVLGLSPRQVEQERKRCQLRYVGLNGSRLYSSYDLAMLAARLHGKEKMSGMKTIPEYVRKPDTKREPAEL